MRFFDAAEVHRLLDYESLVEALAARRREDVAATASHILEQPSPSGALSHFLSLPAWPRGAAIGEKRVTVFPDNERFKNGGGGHLDLMLARHLYARAGD